jgi:spectinomycin phosphotransferase
MRGGDGTGGPDGPVLMSWVREDFGLDLVAVDRVLSGADASATMWRGSAADGRAYALKLTGGGTHAGLVASAHLARHGVAGVPAPLPAATGRVWSDRAGRRLSVVPWVSDRDGIGAMTPAHWAAFGRLLGRVHAAPVTGDAAALPPETYTHVRATQAVRTVRTRLGLPGAGRDPAAGTVRHGLDTVGEAVARAWLPAADGIAALVAHADALGTVLRRRAVPGVVCHGDPHLGNVLVGDGGRVWLIDWDDAVLAPRELDLMLLLGGMGSYGPEGDGERARLLDGYGPVDLDPDLIGYFRCRRALEDVADWAARALDGERWTVPERQEALDIARSTLEPGGLVALALRDL